MVKNLPSRKPLIVAALLLLSVFSFGQVTLEKIKRHNGDPNSNDLPQAIAVDKDGNVCVTGLSYDATADYATIKYSSSGSVKWTKRYNGTGNGSDDATAVVMDASGNVYVTGRSAGNGTGDDMATIKYSPDGSQLWVKRYNGPANGPDGATAIAVDASGNVYVTGSSEGNGTGGDYATIKYDKSGAQLWVARYNGTANGSDGANALAVDKYGNVYVTGQSAGAGTLGDMTTVKYSAAGAELWAKRHNGPVSRTDRATSIAVDGPGNVYVTGRVVTVLDEDGDLSDYATIKYNAAGVQQWAVQYNGAGNEVANDIAVDGSGNVYITGLSGPVEEDPNNDIATVKYNAAGVQQWARRYNGPGGEQGGGGNDLLLDASGNVYVTGSNAVSPGFNDLDFVTIKYTSGGTQQWVAIMDGPGNNYDAAHAIGIDGSGNLYVTGQSAITQYNSHHSTAPNDYATVKYNASGVQQWVKRYNGPGLQNAGLTDDAADLVADNSGHVYVTGGSTRNETGKDYATIKYDEAGNRLWTRWYNGTGNGTDMASAIVRDASGNIYVTGESDGGTGSKNMDYATIKYDASGNQKWVKRYNGPGNDLDRATAIAVDASGNVYVTGVSLGAGGGYQHADYATIKYDAAGNQKWVKRYNGTGNHYDRAAAIAVDGSGNVYVTGASPGLAGLDDYATVKYDASGNEKWVARYNGPGNSTDEARSLAVDASGNVYVTGSSWGSGTNTDYATIKYNTSGGQLWLARYNGPSGGFDGANVLLLDGSGNVYVTGGSSGIGTGDDFTTIKYSNSGTKLWEARYNAVLHTDVANSMALDASGNVYVTGQSYGDEPTYWDYATVRYNAAGVQQWVQRYSGTLSFSTDAPCGVAVNSSGTVFVTGTSPGVGTDNDYLTLIYSQAAPRPEAVTTAEPEQLRETAARFRITHFPNPVSASARIRYELPSAGRVSLKVYDVMGREVTTLVNAPAAAGTYNADFDASALQKGTYYYRLTLQTEKGISSLSGHMTVIR